MWEQISRYGRNCFIGSPATGEQYKDSLFGSDQGSIECGIESIFFSYSLSGSMHSIP
jgi:hypothetical protein